MSPPLILDASALLAIAKGETGDEKVLSIIHQASRNIFIHAINAFEVVYKLMLWGFSESSAWEFVRVSGAIKIDDAGDFIGRRAVRLKIANPHLSLGDCFFVVLAEELHGRVLTSDSGIQKAQTAAGIIMLR